MSPFLFFLIGIPIGMLLGALIVKLIGAIFLTVFKREGEYVSIGEYQLYETAPTIARRWYDPKLVGTCSSCGLDDAPIVLPLDYPEPQPDPFSLYAWGSVEPINLTPQTKCKWCAELDNLQYHLKNSPRVRIQIARELAEYH